MLLLESGDHLTSGSSQLLELEAIADELGIVTGRIERELSLKVNAAISDLCRHDAEREARFVEVIARIDRREAERDLYLTQLEGKLRAAYEEKMNLLRDGAPGPQGERGEKGDIGERGERGEKGDIGPVGARGHPGVDGIAGPVGMKGEIGERGEKGEIGLNGKDGKDGRDGINGTQGERGEKGEQGESQIGEKGERGEQGETGQQGIPGTNGEKGERGEKGLDGERGLAGDRGAQGERGLQGEKGDQGLVGERGLQGEKGDQGLTGARGEIGLSGYNGVAGEKGDMGLPGPRGEQGERGEQGPQGKLPLIKTWSADDVHYQGDVVQHQGSTYQALRDTAKAPEHKDWALIAARGIDGESAKSFSVRGTYVEKGEYSALDIVTLNSTWFIARKDNPGICPGADWQSGPTGRRGEKGERGDRGPAGARGEAGAIAREIVAWDVDIKGYTATPVMSDGSRGAELAARVLFEQFQLEAM